MDVSMSETVLSDVEMEGDEAIPDTLDVYTPLPTQTAVKEYRDEFIEPTTTLHQTGNINFKFFASDEEMLDVYNTYLHIDCRIVAGNSDNLQDREQDEVIPVNGLGHALFKGISVRLNHHSITQTDNLYPYRGDFSTRINLPAIARLASSSMPLAGWDEEDAGAFEHMERVNFHWLPPAEGAVAWKPGSKVFKRRWDKISGSKTFRLVTPIYCDFFQQKNYLPPGVTVDISLDQNDHAFVLLSKVENASFKVVIDSCRILARFVTLDTQVMGSLLAMNAQGKKMVYPYIRNEITYFNKSPGTTDWSEHNLLKGKDSILPRRLFVAFMPQASFQGVYTHDPFNYEDPGIANICLRLGGQEKPYPEITMHRNNDDNDVDEGLISFLKATGYYFNNHNIGVSQENYKKRNFILGWDLTPTGNCSDSVTNISDRRIASLNIRLRAAKETGYALLMYAEYDAEITINSQGVVENNLYNTPW